MVQLEAKKAFADLIGSELVDADDMCVHKPEECIPCGMKGGQCGP